MPLVFFCRNPRNLREFWLLLLFLLAAGPMFNFVKHTHGLGNVNAVHRKNRINNSLNLVEFHFAADGTGSSLQ